MNNAAETLSALIERANATRPVNNGRPYYMSTATTETPIGKIVCFIDYTHQNPKSHGKHLAARWKLNEKVISKADLIRALEQA